MQGTIATTNRDNVTIYTYTSPESGLAVNTHVIGLALSATRQTIAAAGEHMLAGNKAAAGDFVPNEVTISTIDVDPWT